jgi:hypothetical protein
MKLAAAASRTSDSDQPSYFEKDITSVNDKIEKLSQALKVRLIEIEVMRKVVILNTESSGEAEEKALEEAQQNISDFYSNIYAYAT